MKLLNVRGISLFVLFFSFLILGFQKSYAYDRSLLEYYGADHAESEVTIKGTVLMEQATEPTKIQVDPLIRMQMRYMLGLMRSRETKAAALYPKWSFTLTEIRKLAVGSYAVKYDLKTKGVFTSGTTQYTFTIPLNPRKIFAQAKGQCMQETAEESNFWYHWEPLLGNCPLKENVEYFNYTTDLKLIANTAESYPLYDKLVDSNKAIKMTLFFGFEKYGFQNWSPDGGEDWGIRSFNQQREFLKSMGFSETIWTRQQIETLYKAKDRFIPYISEYNLAGSTANIRIRLVLADTGFAYNSTAFHMLLKDALAKESIVAYNGHSGIGHNLDLAAIEKLRTIKFTFNPNYQILFLGSCVPYAYYTEMFFSRKKSATDVNGSLKLDILSYGKESVFANQEDHALTRALVSYAVTGSKQSYQNIIRSSPNYFFGVNGDEDNPTSK